MRAAAAILVARLSSYLALTLGRSSPTDERQRRQVNLIQAAVTALFSKGLALLVGFLSVPLTIGYLGVERYGVWVTISTVMTWLMIADFGVGNSLTNLVSAAYASGRTESARAHITAGVVVLSAIALAIGIVGLAAWPWIDLPSRMQLQTPDARVEADRAFVAALAVFLLGFPLSVVQKILGAYQQGGLANIWLGIGNLASLIGLVLAAAGQASLAWLVVAFSGSQLLVTLVSAIWLFWYHRPELRPSLKALDIGAVRRLGGIGGMFFVIQIAGALIFQTDNIIIASQAGASAVTPYSVAWRLFSYCGIFHLLTVNSLWPAFAEAFARDDQQWVRRAFHWNLRVNLLITVALGLPLVLFGQQFIAWWAGPGAVPPRSLLLWMGIWALISSAMNTVAIILSSSGRIRGQTIYASLTAVTNIALSIAWIGPYGITGVIAATVVAYLLCNVVPATVETVLILRKATPDAL